MSRALCVLILMGCDPAADGPDMGVVDMAAVDMAAVDMAAVDMVAVDMAAVDMAAADMAGDAAPLDSGTAVDSGAGDAAVGGICPGGYGPAVAEATLSEARLTEVSGIAFSRQRPDVIWMHADSGNDPDLFAVDRTGMTLGRLELGAGPPDLEDIAVASCPGGEGHCIWVADTGDNGRNRPAVQVFAVREPAVDGHFATEDAEVVARFVVHYPDGAHDSEALAVAPGGDRFWLFTKVEGEPTRVYAWDTAEAGPGELTEVARFEAPGVAVPLGRMVTAADLHPSGLQLALRVYTGSYVYRFAAPGDLAAMADLEAELVALGPLAEPQGEAIAYDGVAGGLWTVSEDPDGRQPMHHYACE